MSLSEQIREAQERKRLAEERAALAEEHLATLQRAKLLQERLAVLGQGGSGGSAGGEKNKCGEGNDSDIEILGERAREINYHGTNPEWHPLQDKLISVVKTRHPDTPAMEQAASYVNAWIISGFSYASLWDRVASNEHLLSQKKVSKDELPKDLWQRLDLERKRNNLAPGLSISFLVDRTVEHFREALKLQETASTPHRTRRKQKSKEGGASVAVVDVETTRSKQLSATRENPVSFTVVDLDTPPASVAEPPSDQSNLENTSNQELEDGECEDSDETESFVEGDLDETDFMPEELDEGDSPPYRPPSLSPSLEQIHPEDSDQPDLRREDTPRIDTSQMEEDPQLHLLPGHPLHCPPMIGDVDDYLPLCLEVFTLGSSYVRPQLLQIAAQLPGGRRLFIPVRPRESTTAASLLKSMGYRFSREHPSESPSGFVHENSDRVLEVLAPKDAIKELFNWLKSALKRTDKSGVLLASLHRDTFLLFLCFLDQDDSKRLLDIVRCWVALDAPLWKHLGLQKEKRRQLSAKHIVSLLHLDEKSPQSSSSEKDLRWECAVTEFALSSLKQQRELSDFCFALTPTCLERVATFRGELVSLNKLCSHLEGLRMEVNGEDVKAICSLSPRVKDGTDSWQELYAATFCHLLVLVRLTMSRLKSMARDRERYGPERLTKIIQDELGSIWKPSLERIIHATVEWVLAKIRQEEEGETPSVSDSSTCEDSEGSMPDEMHKPGGSSKDDINQRLLRICANEKDESKEGNRRELRALKSNVTLKRKRNVDEERKGRKMSKFEPKQRKEVTEDDLAKEMELSVQATKWVQVDQTSNKSCKDSEDDMLKQLREDYKEYRQIRKCPPDQFPLHEHLFYHPALAKTVNTDSRHFMLAELCRHLSTLGSLDSLSKTLLSLRQTFEAEELHQKAGTRLKMAVFPSSGQLKKEKLVTLILDWAEQSADDLAFSSSVLKLEMLNNKENKRDGLSGLETQIFHSYLEQAVQMEKRGDLEGFSLDKVDVHALSSVVSSTVAAITEAGFSLTEAVQLHIVGRLRNKLKRQLKHLGTRMEGGALRLLLCQVFNFVDSKIKTEGSLLKPSPFHQKLLSEQVVRLLQDGCLVKIPEISSVKIASGVSFHALETLLPCDDTMDEEHSGEDVKVEGDELTMFGQVELLHPLVLPARSAKILFACVSGLPRINEEAKVKVFSASDNQNFFTPGQSTKVIEDSFVQIKLCNKQKTKVRLAKGTVVGRAMVVNQKDRLPSYICPSYCLHFIKKYYNIHGLHGIYDVDGGDQVIFGADGFLQNPVTLPKDQRTNFKTWGSVWATGLQNYYTVDAIVYFLHQFPTVRNDIKGLLPTSNDYGIYLHLALTHHKPIVRHLDVAVLLAFMKDTVSSCEQIDPNFTQKKDDQLSLLLSTEEDAVEELTLVNNASLKLSCKEFVAVGWKVTEQRASKEVDQALESLEDLGFPIHKLRERYLAVPNHKEHFKRTLKDLIEKAMKQKRQEHAAEMMVACQSGLKQLPTPATRSALVALLSLAQLFGEHSQELDDLVRIREGGGDLGSLTEGLEESLRHLMQILSEKKVDEAEDGDVVIHTAATDQFWSVVATRGNSLLYLASKALGPDVEDFTQLEREAKAVVWALELVRPLLRPNCSVSLPLSSPSMVAMFTPGSTCSKHWVSFLEGLQCIVSSRGNTVNPASALTFARDENERADLVPLDRSTMVQEVALHILEIIKETAKTRSQILKQLRKRQLTDLHDQRDRDRGISSKDDLTQESFPSQECSESFPECSQEDFQPLFEPLCSRFLVGATCKEEAIRKAEKMITWLSVHGVTYADLRQFLEREDNEDEDLEKVVGSYFDSLGMGKIRGRQDLIATSVEHFRQVKDTTAASDQVKLEPWEADPVQTSFSSQESEIELIQLESSDEEMTE